MAITWASSISIKNHRGIKEKSVNSSKNIHSKCLERITNVRLKECFKLNQWNSRNQKYAHVLQLNPRSTPQNRRACPHRTTLHYLLQIQLIHEFNGNCRISRHLRIFKRLSIKKGLLKLLAMIVNRMSMKTKSQPTLRRIEQSRTKLIMISNSLLTQWWPRD